MNLKELHSFKLSDAVTFHDNLNPKLWIGVVLRPDVREQLMTIAQDFLEELGVHDLDVKDITISGSNAAYSYTKHSDLDLHILVDMGNLPVDEVYRELFTAKKTIYNDTHDITIHDIPVELYVQDSRQPVVSLGEYSIIDNKWLKIPTKRRSNFDQTSTKSKYEKLLGLIEIALQSKKYSKVKHIIDTIKRYRQAGLDKGGEFGPENLAYKMLRSQGYITKLYELRDKLHSEKLSFETMYQDIDEEEQFNNELWKPGLNFKQDINGILYHVTNAGKKNDFLSIKAYDKRNPNPIGDAQFAKARNLNTGEVRGVTSMKTKVDPNYQGQGIAANMYALIRMLGVNILPSETQTNAGQKMWSKWRKQGDVNSLKDLDPKVKGVAEGSDFFAGSKFADEDGNTFSVEKIIAFAKKNPKYFHKDFPLSKIKHDLSWWQGNKERMMNADTSFPLLVIQNDDGHLGVADGLNRMKKAVDVEKKTTIDVYLVPKKDIMKFSEKQGVAEEYNTMQFAAEKTPAINPYGGRKDNQYRGAMSEAADKKISFKIQKGDGKFSTTLTVNNSPAGIYQYDSNTGRSIAEVYPEFKGKGLGKLLVLHAIYTAAQLGLDFQEDESRTSAYDNVLDSLSSNGYIVDDDGYWYVTGEGEQYLKRSLNEASGYIPSEKQKNDPRFKTALTVDVHPDSIKKNAKAFYWNTSRAGIPPTAKANGKIS